MPLTERERHDAYDALHDIFGERTDTVIQMLRPDHENLVTKDDFALGMAELRTEMADLRTELKTDMADLRTELKTDMADLRTDLQTEMADLRTSLQTEMADLRTELKTDMAGLGTDLKTDMAGLRVAFGTDINAAFAAQTRTMMIGLVSAVLLIALSNAMAVLVG